MAKRWFRIEYLFFPTRTMDLFLTKIIFIIEISLSFRQLVNVHLITSYVNGNQKDYQETGLSSGMTIAVIIVIIGGVCCICLIVIQVRLHCFRIFTEPNYSPNVMQFPVYWSSKLSFNSHTKHVHLQILMHKRNEKGSRNILPGPNRFSLRSLDSIALNAVPKSRPHSGFWNPGLDHSEEVVVIQKQNMFRIPRYLIKKARRSTKYPSDMP